jgi:ubiquinone/menaquinone biosynthesis C-methylase UbiE
LDVGCAEGKITADVGKDVFHLPADKIFGCDVRQVENQTGFVFKLLNEQDGKLPYDHSSMGVVTALMVLHHVQKLDEELKEIYRVLTPG